MPKLCPRCGEMGGFNKNRAAKDGLQFYCRKCRSELDRLRREEHPEYDHDRWMRIKETSGRREHHTAYMRAYRASHPEVVERRRAYDRARRAADPETMRAKHRRWKRNGRRHGLLLVERQAYWDWRGGLCDFCRQPYPRPPDHDSVVDHDHAHCDRHMGCAECVRGQGHRSCNQLEGSVQRAVAEGLITGYAGRLAEYLADPPLRKWLLERADDAAPSS